MNKLDMMTLGDLGNLTEKLLRSVMSTFDAILINLDFVVETLESIKERKKEVVPLDQIDNFPIVPHYMYIIHIVGTAEYKKREMKFFAKFFIRSGEVNLVSFDVYDTKEGKNPPEEGENILKKAIKKMVKMLMDALLSS